jgi:hypothetical protein
LKTRKLFTTRCLIEISATSKDGNTYKLTSAGTEFGYSGKTIDDLISAEQEKEDKLLKREKREDEIKDLQLLDLTKKVNEINEKQLKSWESQAERNKQLTLLAIIAILFSFVAMLKSFGIL